MQRKLIRGQTIRLMISKEYWKNISIVFWIIIVTELLLLFLALIIGRTCGYREAIIGFGVLGAFLGFPMIIVVLLIILVDLIRDMIERK